MKITKRELKFDMVLNGEKINSLDELREHPSTELIEMQKDGRLSRWLRTLGGANKADKICRMPLSGNTARDLYAIYRALDVDIELEDVIDAIKDENPKDSVPDCDSVDEDFLRNIDEDPEIKKRKDIFLNIAGKIVDGIRKDIWDATRINTNIDSFKNKKQVVFISDLNYISLDLSYQFRHDWDFKDYYYKYINNIFVLKGKDIFIRDYAVIIRGHARGYFYNTRYIFIKGENVVIDLKDLQDCKFIFIIAKNLYINKIEPNTYIVAENVFIESQYTGRYKSKNIKSIVSSIVCAKNILSIGYGWAIPPFMKSKEELISQNVSIKRDYPSIQNLFLSAGTFLYGCSKEGCALKSTLAILCYNVMKKTMLDWAEEKGIFTPEFWKVED